MIEIYLLEQLCAFEECATLSRAAQMLHISQPALTHSMQKLEEQMGVSLFERTKNRITLNENGKLTAQYARRILAMENDMIERVQPFDKSQRTITLGSCAPVPISDITPLLTTLFPQRRIAFEIRNHDEELLEGLYKGNYQLVVLHEPPQDSAVFSFAYRTEQIFLMVPKQHPLAVHDSVSLQQLDGQNLLLYTKIGFWYEMCKERMPHTHFLMMNEMDAFDEVAKIAAFPSFSSDVMIAWDSPVYPNQKRVMIDDPCAAATYYCCCMKKDHSYYHPLFHRLHSFQK